MAGKMISGCDAGEVADLFFHTLVALAHHRVDLKDVYRKLQSVAVDPEPMNQWVGVWYVALLR